MMGGDIVCPFAIQQNMYSDKELPSFVKEARFSTEYLALLFFSIFQLLKEKEVVYDSFQKTVNGLPLNHFMKQWKKEL